MNLNTLKSCVLKYTLIKVKKNQRVEVICKKSIKIKNKYFLQINKKQKSKEIKVITTISKRGNT